jgi:GNAT superfamily N-acetyltransferase
MPQTTRTEFTAITVRSHRDQLVEINVEYVSWVFREIDSSFGVNFEKIIGMSASDYVLSVIDKVCGKPPPEGIFYLVNVDGRIAGMGGLRGLNPIRAELKRMYIRPEFRGMRLGDRLLERLISDATAFGYKQVCLDSAPFMKAAHRVYENKGFVDCPSYEGVEVPHEFHDRWRFMERAL